MTDSTAEGPGVRPYWLQVWRVRPKVTAAGKRSGRETRYSLVETQEVWEDVIEDSGDQRTFETVKEAGTWARRFTGVSEDRWRVVSSGVVVTAAEMRRRAEAARKKTTD